LSPDVIQPVPAYDITVPRGATRIVRFTILKDGANVDLSLPLTGVVFTAKDRDDDVTPLIQKAYASTGMILPGITVGGITANHIDTSVPPDGIADTWVADVTLAPTDTENIAQPLLHYDLWLFDPSGQEAPCAQGTLRLSPTVLRP
jgi:hypothetical protein